MKIIQVPDDLIDEELASVCFVRDYVEFNFDGPILRSMIPVRARGPNAAFEVTQGEVGWRDKLCTFIGMPVTDVIVDEKRSITIAFAGGSQIQLPLDVVGPGGESAHFQPQRNDHLQVW